MLGLWCAAIVIFLVFLYQRLSDPVSKLPGPWYTKLTSLVIKYHEFSASRRVFIHQLHKQYGTIVRIAPNEVSFASLDAIREIYASGGSGYDKTELYDLFRQFGIKTMFSTLDKQTHSERKRQLADRYAMSNILREHHVSAIRESAKAFVSKCASIAKSVDVYIYLHCYALDCVTHFMFSPSGLKSLTDENDFELMEEMTYHNSLQKNLLPYYLPHLAPYFPSWLLPRRAPKSNAYVHKVTAQTSPDEYSLLARLLRKDSSITKSQAAAECKDHMAAGIDTTGDGLCFLMWELSQPHNFRFQDRLYEELRSAPEGTHIDRLPYLDAVIKEALRCAPPIPMSFPRYVPSGGRTIDGTFIPEGIIVSCQPYTVHRLDEKVFPDPDTFNPDRWMEEDGINERNRLFFAFSTGGRGCTGRNLATVEMKILLQEVYARFQTTVAPDMTSSMEIDDQIISLVNTMHMSSLSNWATVALQALLLFSPNIPVATSSPSAPELSFLYTAYVECESSLMSSPGPHGVRRTIPIVGGNFTGPNLSGKILDVGADWGLVDPQTGIFSADTRYNFRTDDGENIFLQTSGPKSPSGQLHLRLVFETGSRKYYWLNNVVAIGILTSVAETANTSLLRIDAWNMATDWNSTSFLNPTTTTASG
ncbi:cytochrome P450 [Aspergillus eucalypticola CBS 122712]|uniref:Cytochrome P450 n=1 Tax=Aspergillus eucalypticola (strain CBS 122712 / IBT 29274) TaxID=1448314 RepID=A0A317V5U6_ASPEC|nr:cytochrome P450 [Aspergillus eucalypticola CBS 122712]PWY69425.1 cytochrome P450 [Aspergillus eucalypticola CBS 122712]